MKNYPFIFIFSFPKKKEPIKNKTKNNKNMKSIGYFPLSIFPPISYFITLWFFAGFFFVILRIYGIVNIDKFLF